MRHTQQLTGNGKIVEVRAPLGVEDLLQDILEELRDQNNQGVKSLHDSQDQNYSIGSIAVVDPLTIFHVRVALTRRITFFEFPQFLRTFNVFIGEPAGKPFNILRSPVIQSDVPFRDIYITTAPDTSSTFGGQVIRFLIGNVTIDALPCNYAAACFQNVREFPTEIGGDAGAGSPVAIGTPNQPCIFSSTAVRTSAGAESLYTGIPAGFLYKLRWWGMTRLPSTAGTLGAWDIESQNTTGGTRRFTFIDGHVPESGDLKMKGESGFVQTDQNQDIVFNLNSVVALSRTEVHTLLEVHPFP